MMNFLINQPDDDTLQIKLKGPRWRWTLIYLTGWGIFIFLISIVILYGVLTSHISVFSKLFGIIVVLVFSYIIFTLVQSIAFLWTGYEELIVHRSTSVLLFKRIGITKFHQFQTQASQILYMGMTKENPIQSYEIGSPGTTSYGFAGGPLTIVTKGKVIEFGVSLTEEESRFILVKVKAFLSDPVPVKANK